MVVIGLIWRLLWIVIIVGFRSVITDGILLSITNCKAVENPWLGLQRSSCTKPMMTSSNGNIFRVTGLCEGNPPVTGGFPSQRPETRSFDVFFDLRLNKRLSKRSRCWWFEAPSRSLWRHCNVPISPQSHGHHYSPPVSSHCCLRVRQACWTCRSWLQQGWRNSHGCHADR